MLLKRAQPGRLGLVKAAKALMDEILSGPSASAGLVPNAKKITLLLLSLAFEKFGDRSGKTAGSRRRNCRCDHGNFRHGIRRRCAVSAEDRHGCGYGAQCCSRIRWPASKCSARPVLARPFLKATPCAPTLAVLRRFAKYEPVDSIALRRRIAERLLTAGPVCRVIVRGAGWHPAAGWQPARHSLTYQMSPMRHE